MRTFTLLITPVSGLDLGLLGCAGGLRRVCGKRERLRSFIDMFLGCGSKSNNPHMP